MNYTYFPIVFLLACPQLIAMEQCATVLQKPASKTVPSLKELALKAYAQYLHNNVSKEDLSYAEIVAWGDRRGLGNFFDLNLSSPLTIQALQRILGQPRSDIRPRSIEKYGLNQCITPQIFSDTGRYQLFQDSSNNQYIVHVNEKSSMDRMLLIDDDFRFTLNPKPLFSPDGRSLLGRSSDSPYKLVLVQYGLGKLKTAYAKLASADWDYAVLNEDTVLVRTEKEIFAAQFDDLFKNGEKSFQKIYERTECIPFYLHYKRLNFMHGVSGPCIVLVHDIFRESRKIELIKRSDDGTFSANKTIPLIGSGAVGKIIVHRERGILAQLVEEWRDERVELYQLFGDDAGGKLTIPVQNFVNFAFSPCGNYLACEFTHQITLFDCTCLISPKKISWKNYHPYGFYSSIDAWTDLGLIVGGCANGRQIIVQFNRAAPLVAAYAAHRENEKKEKATDKNRS